MKFENGLFRIKNKLTVCSLPSFLPRTNGINFFNSERGVNLTPPSDLPVKSGKLTRASRSSISFLSSSFYAADVSNEGREGPNEAIHFSPYSSSSNAASPLFREMEITRIKCLHPPQCRSTVPSSRSPPNLLQSFHGDTIVWCLNNFRRLAPYVRTFVTSRISSLLGEEGTFIFFYNRRPYRLSPLSLATLRCAHAISGAEF